MTVRTDATVNPPDVVARISEQIRTCHMRWPAPQGDCWARCAAIDGQMAELVRRTRTGWTLDTLAVADPDAFDQLHDVVDDATDHHGCTSQSLAAGRS